MLRALTTFMFLFTGAAAIAQGVQDVIVFESCIICHGQAQTDHPIPPIAGRPRDELLARMSGFAGAAETSTIMHRFVVGLTPAEMENLADHISRQQRPAP